MGGKLRPCLPLRRVFVERCQNFDPSRPDDLDGGFFFSTTEEDTNKAGRAGNHFRSYGTTTADGITALLATGHAPDSARVTAARRWLVTHHRDMDMPGFTGDALPAMAARARVLLLGVEHGAFALLRVDESNGVAQGLLRTQRGDGSWANSENS